MSKFLSVISPLKEILYIIFPDHFKNKNGLSFKSVKEIEFIPLHSQAYLPSIEEEAYDIQWNYLIHFCQISIPKEEEGWDD